MFFPFLIIHCVNCFGKTVLYLCIEYPVYVNNMYNVSALGVDERMINGHYYHHPVHSVSWPSQS